jgi:hypothetical protein
VIDTSHKTATLVHRPASGKDLRLAAWSTTPATDATGTLAVIALFDATRFAT